jgi:DNA-3-methyladenine glycosylase
MKKLGKDFFLNDTLWVAKNLIGKKIIFNIGEIQASGIITETEAYFGSDEASHGARGKTPRNEAMFLTGGITYIYLIYGIYHCLNFVTENENFPAAVLIRGINLTTPEARNLNGPGKICKYLELNKNHNKINIYEDELIELYDINSQPKIIATPRIGISKNKERPWRFLIQA